MLDTLLDVMLDTLLYSPINMLIVYSCCIILWLVFQSAVNHSFPDNDFMPRNMVDTYGGHEPSWGLLAALVWPAVALYLIMRLVLVPFIVIPGGIRRFKGWRDEQNKLKNINVPTFNPPQPKEDK